MLSALKADFADFKNDSGIAAAKKAPPKKKKRVDAGGFQRKSARLSATPEDKDKIGEEVTYSNMREQVLNVEVSHAIVLYEILDPSIFV